MQLSIVIPLYNECGSLSELNDWIVSVMHSNRFDFEVIYIDDGSTDGSWEVIEQLCARHPEIKAIQFQKNFGKSQALHAGFKAAVGDVVITMDADLQDSPEEIPDLIEQLQKEELDLVSGWKKKRYDSLIGKNIPSKLFNWAARRSSGIKLNDFNCGLKAYRSEVIKNIDVHGEMHRYIPVLAANAGFNKIAEKEVKHQARKYGETKFGAERFINGFLDLITIGFVSKFGKRPMHFFGAIGLLMFIIGTGLAIYLGIDKLFIEPKGRLITERPEFFIALTTMILGTQLFLAGFIGELVIRSKSQTIRYQIKQSINHITE
ncbi:MAG: glycosyltransferase [Flavobacteriaceae bacterium]|nr:glycosyltransferase [Flavobacteriaceae bacterium]